MPDTVYVIGVDTSTASSRATRRASAAANGRSNGREVALLEHRRAIRTRRRPTTPAHAHVHGPVVRRAGHAGAVVRVRAVRFDNGCVQRAERHPPDQHAIAINPGNPTQIFEGSDGGDDPHERDVRRHLVAVRRAAPQRRHGPLPATSGSYTALQAAAVACADELAHIDKKLSSTLQFINVAINPSDDERGHGRDAGQRHVVEPRTSGDRNTFTQVIYGDGGNAGYDATKPTWRFNEFTSGFSRLELPERRSREVGHRVRADRQQRRGPCVLLAAGRRPEPGSGHAPDLLGREARLADAGRSARARPGTCPQDTTPDIAFYEANCPEFVDLGRATRTAATTGRSAARTATGSTSTPTIPSCINQPGDLTGTVYGADRARRLGLVDRPRRRRPRHALGGDVGRPDLRHAQRRCVRSGDGGLAPDRQLASGSPTRFPSGIYVDPANTGHAWVSYSGYNAATPTTLGPRVQRERERRHAGLGHVHEPERRERHRPRSRRPTNDGDLPVSDVVRDDANAHAVRRRRTSASFAATTTDGGWHVTAGMPRYEVMHLEIQPSSRVPRVHGRQEVQARALRGDALAGHLEDGPGRPAK